MEPEQHPNEPILEAILQNQDEHGKSHEQILEAILQKTSENNHEDILSATMVHSVKNTDKIVDALKKPTTIEIEINGADMATYQGGKGEKGDKGDKGDQGERGLKGEKGIQGEKGERGDDGINGIDGIDGINGINGRDGLDGKDGEQGIPGIPGRDGKDGKDGKSVSEELVKKLQKTIRDSENNLLYVNNGAVKSITAGSNITITGDAQNPVISSSGGGGTWGTITGTLSAQSDLQTALNAKQGTITTGTTAQYFRGDLSLATFPTNNTSFTNGAGYIVGPASATDNAIVRYDGTTGKLGQNSTVTIGDNGDMSWSVSTDIVALSVTNSLATSREYPVMLITNDSASGVGLRIVHTNASNSQGGIRLDSPSPEIEFVETDQVGTDGTGKFEIRVQNDIFSINGRNSDDSSFEQAFTFERLADGGRMATGGENNPAAMIEAVHTGTNPYFYASSSTSADGDVFSVNNNGVLAVGNWTNAAAATGKIQLNSNATSPSSIDLSNTIAVGTGGGGANATSRFLGQFGWVSRDSSFTAPKLVAYIGAEATETYAADTDTGSDMAFYTGTNDGTSPTEKFRIGQNGLLNIGGGKTSSFPALKRSSANLQVRLGDDSAASDIEVADEAFGSGWNGSLEVPTKNAIYDKLTSSQLPTIVVAASGGDTTTIQGALDIAASTYAQGCKIYLTDDSYTITTGLLVKSNNVIIEGNNQAIEVDGNVVATLFKTNSAAAGYEGFALRNLRLVQTNASALGIAIDASDMALQKHDNLVIYFFATGIKMLDTQNITFYNRFANIKLTQIGSVGINIDSHTGNPVNDNMFDNIRCSYAASGIGVLIDNAQSNNFYNCNFEPGSNSGTVGVKLLDTNGSSTFDNSFYGVYIEANATGISVGSGVNRTSFFAGEVVENTANLSDSGTDTAFFNTDIGYVAKNKTGNMGYTMQVLTRDTNVADATTYYMGGRGGNTITTTDVSARLYIPQSGTVKKIYLNFVNLTTNATSETSTIYFRLNDTTDTTISSAIVNDSTTNAFNNTALSIAVTAGDFFTLKWVTPTWTTNPQGCQMTATVWIQPS